MEEVDNIIIHSLRKVGWAQYSENLFEPRIMPIREHKDDIEDEVDTLKQFTPELVVEAAVRCLDIIQPGLGLPHSLPPSMSARFRLGANLAEACSDLGYPGEIGYQTFLYSNEADVRKVFMFLIEKLPKEAEKSIVEPAGRTEILEKEISDVLKKQLSCPWLPSYCWRRGIRWREDGTWSREGCGHYQPFISCNLNIPKTAHLKSEASQAWCEYYVHHLPLVTDQLAYRRQLVPSLITLNEKLMLPTACSKPLNSQLEGNAGNECQLPQRLAERIAQDLDKLAQLDVNHPLASVSAGGEIKNTPSRHGFGENVQSTQERETHVQHEANSDVPATKRKGGGGGGGGGNAADMKVEIETLKEEIKEMQLDIKKLTAKLNQITEELPGEEKTLKELQERHEIKKRTYDLLPDADENIKKLQAMVDASAQRLVALAMQWEKHRAPLVEEYRNARERNSNKASESQKQADAVRALKEKARELSEEIKSKEQLHSQLVAELETVSKDTKRSAYTRRIMEIIGNIRKQKEEIDKVICDTRELQKEINNLTGRLDRSFTDADERIFRDAKKDEVARRAYKLLATLHADCSELVQIVEETGAIIREIRDLEEQIEIESAKNVKANLERVSADLKQMKQENAALTAQLKSKLQSQQGKPV